MRRSIPLALAILATFSVIGCARESPSSPEGTSTLHGEIHTAGHSAPSHVRAPASSAELNRQLAELRRTTAGFHSFDRAAEAGYSVRITPCWEHRTQGAMGYHYGNPDLIDATVDLLEPEVLMYEPGPGGHLRLVGMEYIVPLDAWTAESPPRLLGQEFHPHSFLPIYKLHIWLWRENSRGIFADWNPKVSCRHAAETELF